MTATDRALNDIAAYQLRKRLVAAVAAALQVTP